MGLKDIAYGIVVALLLGCSGNAGQQLESKAGFAVITPPASGEQVATYAGGCFWAMQECMLELKGVHKVISGYAGGAAVNPTYEQVSSNQTGHAESVQVYYDPQIISFEKLTEAFFHAHDPTQVDRQGPDIGSDYRSIAFFRSPEEYRTIQKVIARIERQRSGSGADVLAGQGLATEVLPFKVIYPAESSHQDYYVNHSWDFYIRNVSKAKVMKLRKEMPDLIKPEYLQ